MPSVSVFKRLSILGFLPAGALCAALLSFLIGWGRVVPENPPVKTAVLHDGVPEQETVPSPAPPEKLKEIKGILRTGDSFAGSLQRLPLPEKARNQIIDAFAALLDFKKLRPDDCYSIYLDHDKELVKCIYQSGPLDIYAVNRTPQGLKGERLPVVLERRTKRLSGTIASSLYAAFMHERENPKLIRAFADIFASRIDFNTETRRGDRFSMVFEKYYKDNKFIGYGKILAARYQPVNSPVLTAFLYAPLHGREGYFDWDGREMGASFIRSPVPLGRVTSRFTLRRKHPVSGVVRPHLGVDLAAPAGTPVMATADGRVGHMRWTKGFGKQVVLNHKGGYRTYYGHLSRFRKGLKKGMKVRQKDIIGYVGSTGVSTGPHLDYRIEDHGVFKNPFALKFKPKSVLDGKDLIRLRMTSNMFADSLDQPDQPEVLQVKTITVSPPETICFL